MKENVQDHRTVLFSVRWLLYFSQMKYFSFCSFFVCEVLGDPQFQDYLKLDFFLSKLLKDVQF